jgi:AcrR family transcriptional regulator
MTMDDLANRLGISKKTIYQYFEDKNDLVNQVFNCILNEHSCEVNNLLRQEGNAIELFLNVVKAGTERLKEFNPIVFLELQKYHHESWMAWSAFKQDQIAREISTLIERGIEDGLFRSDLNVAVAINLHLAHMDLVTAPEFIQRVNLPAYRIVAETMLLFLRGIASENGLELLKNYKILS